LVTNILQFILQQKDMLTTSTTITSAFIKKFHVWAINKIQRILHGNEPLDHDALRSPLVSGWIVTDRNGYICYY